MLKTLLPATAAAAILALIGTFSVLVQQPWLVPSLGSAAFVQILSPEDPAARPWATVAGQLLGVLGGFAGVHLAGAVPLPSFQDHHPLSFMRVYAVAIAALVTALLQILFKAKNPAGGAVAVIIAIGATSPGLGGIGSLVIGIALVSLFGETGRYLIRRI